MPFASLLSDSWPTDAAVVRDDTTFLAELIWAHLVHHFSTPGVLLTWSEESPHRIQSTLERVASYYPLVKPTCALRAMLVVLSIKKAVKGGIAYGLDAELLFQMAFKSLAARHDPTLTDAIFTSITDSFYVGTKMHLSPDYVEDYVVQSLSDEQKPLFDIEIGHLQRYYLAPWFPGVDVAQLRIFAAIAESPSMPSYTLLKPQGPSRLEQTLVFPDPRPKGQLLSQPIAEEVEPEDGYEVVLVTHTPEPIGAPASIEMSSSVSSEASFLTALSSFSYVPSESSLATTVSSMSLSSAGSGDCFLPASSIFTRSRIATSFPCLFVHHKDEFNERPKTIGEALAMGLGPIIITYPPRSRAERARDFARRIFMPWTKPLVPVYGSTSFAELCKRRYP